MCAISIFWFVLYDLAVIMDVFSRKVIGYALSRNIGTQLCLDALRLAFNDRGPRPGCIHHSDRGVKGDPALAVGPFAPSAPAIKARYK